MVRSPSYPVPALEKGLDILETLAAVAEPQSLADLAGRLKRSRSELFRMLACLEQRGYLSREASTGRYALTLKLYAVAQSHSPMRKLLAAARHPMQRLTERTGESCHLSVLDRGCLVVVAQQESPSRVRLSIEVGGEFDPVKTASGRLLLASMQAEERVRMVADSPTGKAFSAKDRNLFFATLSRLEKAGVSTAESETIEGVRDVAVAIPGSGALGPSALAITRLLRRGSRGDEASLILALQEAASDITRTLGLSTP